MYHSNYTEEDDLYEKIVKKKPSLKKKKFEEAYIDVDELGIWTFCLLLDILNIDFFRTYLKSHSHYAEDVYAKILKKKPSPKEEQYEDLYAAVDDLGIW